MGSLCIDNYIREVKLPGFFCDDLNMKRTIIETYLYSKEKPSRFLFPVLNSLAYFQKWGMWVRSQKTVYRPNIYVVSFGGITIGGVGKTPAVIERLENETKDGNKKICVISRGYGTKKYRGIIEGCYKGENVHLRKYYKENRFPVEEITIPINKAYTILGDELSLILYRIKNITVVKDSNRVRAVKWAEHNGFNMVILDDAYQYLMIGRNENILLLSALNPWGNGLIFPAGILREPLDAMHRATEIWITHCDQVPKENLKKLKIFLKDICPEKKIRWTYHKPLYWTKKNSSYQLPVDYFTGKDVDVFCAVGNPQSFLNILGRQQINIKNTYLYRDHTPIPSKILKGERVILTTEKNLLTLEEERAEVYALCIGLADYLWD
ncbi:MAG: tetraacyldisaccharide 4'-kinase [Candidatus Hydrogenedens sp.]